MTATRRPATAEVLSVGSELLVGETRDTNSGEIATALSDRGARVMRIQALPDDLAAVRTALADALERVDLVITTGGLGPTPDDLTREAIGEVCHEQPVVDPAIEAWLRERWRRRRSPFPDSNLKQAWLIPSAVTIPNDHGSAPGWWVARPDGRIIVALPGPPREMRPMWTEWVIPRLAEAGLARPRPVVTLRLAGIGESEVVDRLGEPLLRARNPIVATYARADAVDVRISARDEAEDGVGSTGSAGSTGQGTRAADALVAEAEALVLQAVGGHVWARGHTTWHEVVGAELERRGWTMAVREIATGGAVTALLGDVPGLIRAESLASADGAPGGGPALQRGARAASRRAIGFAAQDLRSWSGADVGLVVMATEPERGDVSVSIGLATPDGVATDRQLGFLGGRAGRSRAALAAAWVVVRTLRNAGS